MLVGDFGFAAAMGSASGSDIGHAVATDTAGNVYATGRFRGTVDFDPGAGTTNLTSAGQSDVFVTKLNDTGGLIWVQQIGGSFNDTGYDITVDIDGNVYVTGSFSSTVDFDAGAGTANLTSSGSADVFVLKLDSNGDFVYARGMGGSDGDFAYSMVVSNLNRNSFRFHWQRKLKGNFPHNILPSSVNRRDAGNAVNSIDCQVRIAIEIGDHQLRSIVHTMCTRRALLS